MGSCVQGLFCNIRFQAVYVDGAGKNGLRLCGDAIWLCGDATGLCGDAIGGRDIAVDSAPRVPAGSTSSYLSSLLFKAHGTQEFMPQKKIIPNRVVTFRCSVFVEIHCDLLNFKPVNDTVPTY